MYCIKKTKIMYRQTVIKVYKKKAKQNVFKINEKINISRMITKKRKKKQLHIQKKSKKIKRRKEKKVLLDKRKEEKKNLKTITSVTKTKNQGKKRKRKKEVNTSVTKDDKKKKSQRTGNLMANFKGIFESSFYEFLSFNYFFHFGKKKFLLDDERKHLDSTIYFLSFPPFILGCVCLEAKQGGRKILERKQKGKLF